MSSSLPDSDEDEDLASGMAYGLVFRGVSGPGLLEPDSEARRTGPTITVTVQVNGVAERLARELSDDSAVMDLIGGQVVVDRHQASATFHMAAPIGPHELVHPYLSPVASVFSWWLGRACFHAGGFVLDGRAWGVLGQREAGKSTALAWLHRLGLGVVADDVMIVDGPLVHTGPRILDLRPGAAEFMGGADLVVVREGERSRLHLPPLAATHPLAGWVVLKDSDHEVEVVRVSPPDRLAILANQLAVRRPPSEPVHLLPLSALPMWAWRRPHRFETLAVAAHDLLATLSQA